METIHNQKQWSIRMPGNIVINYNTLCMLACIVYFAQDAIRVIIGNALPVFSRDGLTWLMIFLMYAPLLIAFFLNPSKMFPAVGSFLILLVFVASFFYITYLVHPEYEWWFFEGSYPVMDWIFRPNMFIYAYLFISIIEKPEDGINALKIVGYLLLAYYTFKLVRAKVVGYWVTTTTASGPQNAEYDLNYGYDHLIVFAIFFGCGFKEKKVLYFVLAAISFIEILMGGSRAPLLAVAVMMLLMYFRYRKDLPKAVRIIVFFAAGLMVLLYVALGLEGVIVLLGTVLSKIFGTSSRTIQSLLGGASALDASGRDRLYSMAFDMIKNGFWGYGAYGDRYVIGRVFWVGYAHNVFLELLIDFGWIIGGIFSIKILVAAFRMIFCCKDENWFILFSIFAIPSLKLLLSGSFWFLEAFWAAAAVYRMYSRTVRKRREPTALLLNEEVNKA